MNNTLNLSEKEKLNGSNFENWKWKIENILLAEGLEVFIEKNHVSDVENKVSTGMATNDELEKVKKSAKRAYAILVNSLTEDIAIKIKKIDKNPYLVMEKLESDYKNSSTNNMTYWMNKLDNLKAKNFTECTDVLNSIKDIFEIIKDKGYSLGDWEKIRYIVNALPTCLEDYIVYHQEDGVDKIIENLAKATKLFAYIHERDDSVRKLKKINKPIKNEDLMDVDYVKNPSTTTKQSNIKHKFSKRKFRKFCHICDSHSHSTEECRYNAKSKNYKKYPKETKNTSKRENKTLFSNLVVNEDEPHDEDSNVDYTDINQDFERNIESIETIIENDQNNDNEPSEDTEGSNSRIINGDVNYIDEHNKIENKNSDYIHWTFDSGCSEHLTNDRTILKNFKEEKVQMKCANNSICTFEGTGTFEGSINGTNVILDKVYYSKHVNKNLLSGFKLTKLGFSCNMVTKDDKTFLIISQQTNNGYKRIGKFLASENNITTIPIKKQNYSINTLTNSKNTNLDEKSLNLWHRRLGHFYHNDLTKYLELHKVKDVECLDCQIAKLRRKPHNGTPPAASRIMETLHSDLIGPIEKSITGKKYILTFLDEYSRKSWIFPLERKSQVPKTTIQFLKHLYNQGYDKITYFKTDNGREFKNRKIENYCSNHGIKKIYSPPYNPQNNGKAERFNYTLENCVKTLLQWSKVDKRLWDFAATYANFLYNITPHKGICNNIPNEVFYNKDVNLKYIKTFGCIAYYRNFSQNKGKFESNAKKGIFLGFNFDSHCYIVMDYHDFSLHFVREVVFDEDTPANIILPMDLINWRSDPTSTPIFTNDSNDPSFFLFTSDNNEDSNSSQESTNKQNNTHVNITNEEEDDNLMNHEPENSDEIDVDKNSDVEILEDSEAYVDKSNNESENNNNNYQKPNKKEHLNNKDIEFNFKEAVEDIVRNLIKFKVSPGNKFHFESKVSGREKKRRHSFDSIIENKKRNLNEYDLHPSSSMENDLDNGPNIRKQDIKQVKPNKSTKRKTEEEEIENENYKRIRENEIRNNLPVKRPTTPSDERASKHTKLDKDNREVLNITTDIPLNFNDALKSKNRDKWIEAIQNELENLYDNKIMTFVTHLPFNKKAIRTKWVFSVKRDSNNNIIKFKARLVAKGFSQIKGIDYELTFSPTLSIDSLKLIIAIAAKLHWEIIQLDIKAAYLNADLDKEIYTEIPLGDKNYKKGFWRLNKALYGLKQSGRQWNETITKFLISIGFVQLSSEPCIFKKVRNGKISCIIGIYVDDMIITGDKNEMIKCINDIKKEFKVSKCTLIDYLLGIKVEKLGHHYSISQTNFIQNILLKFRINNTRKAKTPCTGDSETENKMPFNKTTYKSALGSLIYLSKCTRPDIAFAVNKAARVAENPTISDWHKVVNILKYLNSTKNYKITYKGTGEIVAYTDADLGGDFYDKKSTSGSIILMGTDPICWSSKKQSTVATSTMESEYIGTSVCAKKCIWIQHILYELFNFKQPIKIYTDNLSSKRTIENGQINSKLKHINLKYYFIKDLIKNNKIILEYVSTENMLADVLTKNVNGPKMTKFSNIIFDKSNN